MAATITNAANGTGSGASIVSAATVTVVSGDFLVAVIAFGANRTVTLADPGGNAWTQRASINYDGASTGGYLRIHTSTVTSAFTNGAVTGTLGGGSSAQSAIQIYRVRPGGGETVSFLSADTTGSGTTGTLHSAATVSVAGGDIIFGCGALETNDSVTGDSDTTNGSWSSIVTTLRDDGSDDLSMSACSQYKTVSATGNQSWACSTTSARESARSYLVLHQTGAAFSLAAAQGSYALSGTAATPHLGHTLAAAASSYALTGTAATLINSGVTKTIAADAGSYSLLGTSTNFVLTSSVATYFLTGTAVTLTPAHFIGTTSGSYALTGSDAVLTKAGITNKVLGVDIGAYALTGTDATVTIVAAKSVVAEAGSYSLLGTAAAPRVGFKVIASDVGAYALTGSAATLVSTVAKAILAESASYVLTGTAAALTAGAAAPAVSPLHIGEWPRDTRRRRAQQDASAKEQRARQRFRDAIGRLLEGLPPEFDEPEALDEALDSAVQAANLLYAMSAPIREINAVNELIDHIRQLRIAQPIAKLATARAYAHSHRLLKAKAEEDVVMTLLLGE